MKTLPRRQFLRRTLAAGVALAFVPRTLAKSAAGLRVATNTYPWEMFARRDDGSFILHTDAALAAIASTGISGYEPNMRSPDAFDGLAARLKAHRLDMRSLYVNSTLHDEALSAASVAEVLAIGRRAKDFGTRIVVTNPAPIKWGGPENKTDAQLRHQAARLNELGASLRRLGLTLAYHNHDAELRLGGREFHHMLTATDPKNVKFCLDAHWIYRGCGDSQAALFDALEHYGDRIVELHLRQSQNGVWTEVFTAAGDIDYARLADWLRQRRMKPHLVLEQAVEKGSPKSLDVVEAHRRSLANTRALFHDFD
jgi:inosose dehydratase